MTTPSIGVIVVSTRPGRRGPGIARWVMAELEHHEGLTTTLVDLADIGLPLLDEPRPARSGTYSREQTRRWSRTIDALDGFVFVTPEHNRAMPAGLKNALDHLYREWQHKPAAFVAYSGGASGGVRAVEMARQVATTLSMLVINDMVNLADIDRCFPAGDFQPPAGATDALHRLATSLTNHLAASSMLRAS